MHELPVIESILGIVLKHAKMNNVQKVLAVHLQIGKLSDLQDEWIQRYFDYLSKGTVAEGARVEIERTPIKVQCSSCATSYEIGVEKLGDTACPKCGKKGGSLISGKEYFIKNMEVQ
jgi:hydrogenase nickel incorporation protein HypA/HybF